MLEWDGGGVPEVDIVTRDVIDGSVMPQGQPEILDQTEEAYWDHSLRSHPSDHWRPAAMAKESLPNAEVQFWHLSVRWAEVFNNIPASPIYHVQTISLPLLGVSGGDRNISSNSLNPVGLRPLRT